MFWSGRPDLNRGPPAPKAGVISPGSPSFSISVLKINELEKYLVVARCTEMWLRMHGVPRIFPIAKKRRKRQVLQKQMRILVYLRLQRSNPSCAVNSVPFGVE